MIDITPEELAGLLHRIHTHDKKGLIIYPELELLEVLRAIGLPEPKWGVSLTIEEFNERKAIRLKSNESKKAAHYMKMYHEVIPPLPLKKEHRSKFIIIRSNCPQYLKSYLLTPGYESEVWTSLIEDAKIFNTFQAAATCMTNYMRFPGIVEIKEIYIKE